MNECVRFYISVYLSHREHWLDLTSLVSQLLIHVECCMLLLPGGQELAGETRLSSDGAEESAWHPSFTVEKGLAFAC